MKMMTKRILVSLPAALYNDLKRLARREYRTVSSLIRESVLDRVEDAFTEGEITLIQKGRKAFRKGEGVEWKDVRGD